MFIESYIFLTSFQLQQAKDYGRGEWENKNENTKANQRQVNQKQ